MDIKIIIYLMEFIGFCASVLTIVNFIKSNKMLKKIELYKEKLIIKEKADDTIKNLIGLVKKIKSKIDTGNNINNEFLLQIKIYINELLDCYPTMRNQCPRYLEYIENLERISQANIEITKENIDNIIKFVQREQKYGLR